MEHSSQDLVSHVGLYKVEGILEFNENGISVNLTPKGSPFMVIEGIAKEDSGDIVIVNARRYWVIDYHAKLLKIYNVKKDQRLKMKNKRVRVIIELIGD